MRSRITIYSIILLSALFHTIDAGAVLRVKPTEIVTLWEKGEVKFGEECKLYCYVPESPVGTSVIVCPGGSYCWLDDRGEGLEVAEWLYNQGITAFVLMYRTAGIGAFIWHYRYLFRGNRHPDMIMDAQRAIQWIREHKDRYNVDPDRLGMMGFSAGGHLVMSAACFSKTNFLAEAGVVPEVSLRPDFVAAIYPVVTLCPPYMHMRSRRALLGDNKQFSRKMKDSLSIEKHIPADCPPVFVSNCVDDRTVDYHNSVMLDSALTVAGITHKYVQFERGGHGYGVSEVYGTAESQTWKWEFLKWLEEVQYYKPQDVY